MASEPTSTHAPGPPGWRIESDSMGEVRVPQDALYGAQTQRAVLNFPISGQRMPEGFIRALLHVKAAAARANQRIGVLEPALGQAIAEACEALANERLASDARLMTHFPVDVFQTGSGTSSNMNANEVIATVASRALGRPVHPNDHVNLGQSSNDAVPSAIHVALAVATQRDLLPALGHLEAVLHAKAAQVGHHVKTGRTHLMDAMPVRLDQVIGGWAAQVHQAAQRVAAMQPALCRLAQGGSAVGTGVNVHPDFGAQFYAALSEALGLASEPAPSFFAAMGAQDTAVAASGQLKSLAVALMKIANDLRWMNSGPLAGLAEIALPDLQPGSSIMPGKVNPVVPEAVAMVAAQVIGNDAAVTIAGQSGNFELNVMLPLVARNAIESVALLASAARALADSAIAGFTVNEPQLAQALARNPILVTALNPVIGYAAAAKIAKEAYRSGRPILDVAGEMTDLGRERLQRLLDPQALTGTAPPAMTDKAPPAMTDKAPPAMTDNAPPAVTDNAPPAVRR